MTQLKTFKLDWGPNAQKTELTTDCSNSLFDLISEGWSLQEDTNGMVLVEYGEPNFPGGYLVLSKTKQLV